MQKIIFSINGYRHFGDTVKLQYLAVEDLGSPLHFTASNQQHTALIQRV
jgi:hypothetical protein